MCEITQPVDTVLFFKRMKFFALKKKRVGEAMMSTGYKSEGGKEEEEMSCSVFLKGL